MSSRASATARRPAMPFADVGLQLRDLLGRRGEARIDAREPARKPPGGADEKVDQDEKFDVVAISRSIARMRFKRSSSEPYATVLPS